MKKYKIHYFYGKETPWIIAEEAMNEFAKDGWEFKQLTPLRNSNNWILIMEKDISFLKEEEMII